MAKLIAGEYVPPTCCFCYSQLKEMYVEEVEERWAPGNYLVPASPIVLALGVR
jgi:hypothetical protein